MWKCVLKMTMAVCDFNLRPSLFACANPVQLDHQSMATLNLDTESDACVGHDNRLHGNGKIL
jgi:hypothetical protein